ncbi:aminofutalosine synthase MqnE [Helicobacter sp. MIT 14-3879]|uniref:aminofutalosine synthase MqnE n=1 Tax=Helicobacter sp. MIT 14-3879 TaxID=2040649 RepID=UPI000E1E2C04|nr:aminofutalosine synthase MqnE [Helicobacter sp. MIT 14-3879]RDU65101.1 aminofutalosine synthase MqnE [Helicobacter sp. MIT 14-3879]
MIDLANLSVTNLVKLYDYDLFELGSLADDIRQELHNKKVYFNMNRHINPSNICADICKFCAFSAHRKNPNPYEMTKDEILSDVHSSYNRGAREIHIVSAHNPNYTYEWYFDIFKTIKSKFRDIHIKAMTAAEVDFLHRKFNKSYEEILGDMKDSGVDSMPGGGAEIFNKEVRNKICKGKVNTVNWLKIHSIWHSMGFKSNATMLFGHIEKREHRIEHILLIRELQDKSGGFNAFIPLLYQRHNNFLNITDFPSGIEILKTIAISRILLPNLPNIKAYWATLGINLAIVAQEFGANDIDGTIEKENIQSAAGANSKKGMSKDDLISQIKDAGFIPVLRDSMYNELEFFN